MNLTVPQYKLLSKIADEAEARQILFTELSDGTRELIALGLCESRPGWWDGTWLKITDAGRAALLQEIGGGKT